jgi:glycosyltransferase involved in cell wall biosynthesis
MLHRAIQSVIDQAYGGRIECIVVSDTTDPLPLPEINRPGRSVLVTTNRRTPGPAGARNWGAETAGGELLAFCDDDDHWLPQKLERQVRALRMGPEASAATCGVYIHFRRRVSVRLPEAKRITLAHLTRSRSTAVHTSTFLVRRADYLGPIGPLDEAMPQGYGEDYEWLLRAARWKPVISVPEPLVRVYWHEASWFDGRWETIIAGIGRLLEKHPEMAQDPSGLARLYGRLAFAHAAAGHRREARRWARRSLGLNWRERRAYLALAVSLQLVPAHTILEFAHRTGRGV